MRDVFLPQHKRTLDATMAVHFWTTCYLLVSYVVCIKGLSAKFGAHIFKYKDT